MSLSLARTCAPIAGTYSEDADYAGRKKIYQYEVDITGMIDFGVELAAILDGTSRFHLRVRDSTSRSPAARRGRDRDASAARTMPTCTRTAAWN